MIIKGDFHSHTCYSDGVISPGRRIILALNNNCDFHAISDHDSVFGSIYAQKFAKMFNLSIIIPTAFEYSSSIGHLLVFGIFNETINLDKFTTISKFFNFVKKNNALVVMAHPAWECNRIQWESGKFKQMHLHDKLFDAVEIINACEDYSETLEYYDKYKPFTITSGSDSHDTFNLTTALNWINIDLRNDANTANDKEKLIYKAIRNGKTAIHLHPNLTGRSDKAIGKELWLGDSETISQAKKKNEKQIFPQNNSGIEITLSAKELFPGEICKLCVTSESITTCNLRCPQLNFNKQISISHDKPFLEDFLINDEYVGEHLYWLIEHGTPKYYSIADIFVKMPCAHRIELCDNVLTIVNQNISNYKYDASYTFSGKTNKNISIKAGKSHSVKISEKSKISWDGPGNDTFSYAVPNLNQIYFIEKFKDWGSINKQKVTPKITPFILDYKLNDDLTWDYGIAYDKDFLYLYVDVKESEFSQPYKNEGLWDGDCVRFAFKTATIGYNRAKNAHSNKKMYKEPVKFDMALTPKGPVIQKIQDWSKHYGKSKHFDLKIWHKNNITSYRIKLKWAFLDITLPRENSCIFYNMQIHTNNEKLYRGFISLDESKKLEDLHANQGYVAIFL